MQPLWFGLVRVHFNGENWTVAGDHTEVRCDHIKLDNLSAKSAGKYFEIQWGIVTMLPDGVVEIS